MKRVAMSKVLMVGAVVGVSGLFAASASAVLVNPRLEYRLNASAGLSNSLDPPDSELIDSSRSGPGTIDLQANASINNANASSTVEATMTEDSLVAVGGTSYFAGLDANRGTSAGSGLRLEFTFQLLAPATMNATGTMSANGGRTPNTQFRVDTRFPSSTLANVFDVLDLNLLSAWDASTVLEPGRYEIRLITTASSGGDALNPMVDSGGSTMNIRLDFTAVGGQAGDFDGGGQVEQNDLNLVLNNWGGARGAWANAGGFSTPLVDQEELNAVLNNWGSNAAPNFASNPTVVPEPSLAALVVLGCGALRRRR
ncbi:MAG: hypothetical protein AAF916_08845 [Planctomycetota bacterium]